MSSSREYVVLLDDDGRPCGQAEKGSVHTTDTPLHLAFSCWLIDDHNRTLLTRRSPTKPTWPSAWTNSFCGHPAPGEKPEQAVVRRGKHELGVDVHDVRLVLPSFRYFARMPNGIAENEVCPVFVGSFIGALDPDPSEVDRFEWIEIGALPELVAEDPDRFSPWLRLQLPEIWP